MGKKFRIDFIKNCYPPQQLQIHDGNDGWVNNGKGSIFAFMGLEDVENLIQSLTEFKKTPPYTEYVNTIKSKHESMMRDFWWCGECHAEILKSFISDPSGNYTEIEVKEDAFGEDICNFCGNKGMGDLVIKGVYLHEGTWDVHNNPKCSIIVLVPHSNNGNSQ
jgi:hypothetical protein